MIDLLIISLLIVLNGIFSMSEIALISAKKTKIQKAANQGNKSAKYALKLMEEPDRFLSTVQIGITLIGILTGIFSGDLLADYLADFLIEHKFPTSYAHSVSQTLIVVIVTYFSIVLGELLPKRMGLGAANKIAMVVAMPMYALSIAAMPFVWILSKSTYILTKLLGVKHKDEQVTEEEIKTLVEEGTASGVVQELEQNIVERTFMLGDLDVASIMTHRREMVVIPHTASYDYIAHIVSTTPFETYPVLAEDSDNVLGMMTLKDFASLSLTQDKQITEVMSKPVYFPTTMSVFKALEELRSMHLSRAFVCDEFGAFVGVITLKDILEALVGEFADDTEDIVQRNESEWYVNGQCPFHKFLLQFNIENVDATEFNTVGGLVLELMERIPKVGECVQWREWRWEVADMDGPRIDKLLLRRMKNSEIQS